MNSVQFVQTLVRLLRFVWVRSFNCIRGGGEGIIAGEKVTPLVDALDTETGYMRGGACSPEEGAEFGGGVAQRGKEMGLHVEDRQAWCAAAKVDGGNDAA